MLRGLIFLAIVLGFAAAYGGLSPDAAAPARVMAASEASPKAATVIPPRERAPIEAFKAIKYDWKKGGFGAVAIVTVTFRNGNSYAVKDPVLECDFHGSSGTRIGRITTTIYQAFPANSSKTVREFNLGFVDGQATKAGCDVIGLSRS